jgi:hypothetical protein
VSDVKRGALALQSNKQKGQRYTHKTKVNSEHHTRNIVCTFSETVRQKDPSASGSGGALASAGGTDSSACAICPWEDFFLDLLDLLLCFFLDDEDFYHTFNTKREREREHTRKVSEYGNTVAL